jgi:IS605 OrfB family transposase
MKKTKEKQKEPVKDRYITVQGILLPDKEQKAIMHPRMRFYDSCERSAYKLICKNFSRDDAIPILKKRYPSLDVRTLRDAYLEATKTYSSRIELGLDPKKIIFGSKKLFNKLKNKKNLTEEKREKLENTWHDSRNKHLYSRGEANQKGNLNLRIIVKDGNMFVRMSYGRRKTILIPFESTSKKLPLLLQALSLGIAYDVRIIEQNNVSHIYIAFKEQAVPVTIGYENGSINVDMNSNPAHLAWTETDSEGNKIDSGVINMPELYDQKHNKRKHFLWKYIHELFELCKRKNKGLYFENIKREKQKKKSKTKNKKQNRGVANFMSGAMRDAIEALFRRGGIAATPVPAYYTTIIGVLKYAPLYGLSGHVGPSVAIGHIGMGIEEKVPKAYLELLNRSKTDLNPPKAEIEKSSVAFRDQRDHSVPNAVCVTQRKKEANPINKNLSIWGDVQSVVLTALSTRLGIKNKKILWIKLKANPSILKKYLHHGFYHDAGG